MEDVFGILIVGYMIISVISAIVKRSQQQAAAPPRGDEWVRPPVTGPAVVIAEPTPEAEVPVAGAQRGKTAATTVTKATPTERIKDRDPVADMDPFDHMMWDEDDVPVGLAAAVGGGPGESAPLKRSVRNALKYKQSVRQAVLLAEVLGAPRAYRRSHRL